MTAKRILAVDDDDSILQTVELVLSPAGYSLTLASSGRQALQELRSGFKGLILMDVMMPRMDGWETIAAIAEEGLLEGNIICMLTAVSDPGSGMEEVVDLVLDYVRKPFTAQELIDAVSESLQWLE